MRKAITDTSLYNIGLYLYFVFAFVADTIPGGNLFIVFSMLLIIASAFIGRKKLLVRRGDPALVLWIAVFASYVCSSRIWAEDPSLTVGKTNAMIFLVIAFVVFLFFRSKDVGVDDILKVFMYGGYTVGMYVLLRYGIHGILVTLQNEDRLQSDLNSNVLGMCVAYALLINLYYLIYGRKFRIPDLLMVPSFVILIATGSRKAIAIVIIGVFLLYILKNLNNRKFLSSLGKILLVILILSVLVLLLSRLPIFQAITKRMTALFIVLAGGGTRVTDGWIRVQYIKLGLQLFRQHPILGIGLGNANLYTLRYWGHNHYLHNNYVELLATLGIIGTVLYYGVFVYFLRIFWKYRKMQRDRQYDVCVILLLIHLIMDFGAVSFYNKETYIFILLFWIEVCRLKSIAYGGVPAASAESGADQALTAP